MNKIHAVRPSVYPDEVAFCYTASALAAVLPRLTLVLVASAITVSNQLKAAVKLKPVSSNIHIYSVSQLCLTLTWEVAQSAIRGSVESALLVFRGPNIK